MKTRLLTAGIIVLVSGLCLQAPAFSKDIPVPSNCAPPPPQYDSQGHMLPVPRDWLSKCLAGTGPSTGAVGNSSTAQVVTDDKHHAVHVLIGGKEILTIDALGLHVSGDIQYTGKITNTGKSGTGEVPTAR